MCSAENTYASARLEPSAALIDVLAAEMRGLMKEDDASVPLAVGPWLYWTRHREGGQRSLFCRKAGEHEVGARKLVKASETMAERSGDAASGYLWSPRHLNAVPFRRMRKMPPRLHAAEGPRYAAAHLAGEYRDHTRHLLGRSADVLGPFLSGPRRRIRRWSGGWCRQRRSWVAVVTRISIASGDDRVAAFVEGVCTGGAGLSSRIGMPVVLDPADDLCVLDPMEPADAWRLFRFALSAGTTAAIVSEGKQR